MYVNLTNQNSKGNRNIFINQNHSIQYTTCWQSIS